MYDVGIKFYTPNITFSVINGGIDARATKATLDMEFVLANNPNETTNRVGPALQVRNTMINLDEHKNLKVKATGSAAAELALIFKDIYVKPLCDTILAALETSLTNQIPRAFSDLQIIQTAETLLPAPYNEFLFDFQTPDPIMVRNDFI